MNDDEVVLALRVEGTRSTPVQLAEFLNSVAAGGLSQGSLVTFFKRAFPAIPLGVLLESGAWNRDFRVYRRKGRQTIPLIAPY